MKNPDGSLLISSSDQAALEEFQKKLSETIDSMKNESNVSEATPSTDVAPASESSDNTEQALTDEKEEVTDELLDEYTNPGSAKYLSYMTEENLKKARERVLLESRTYTVFRIENVGVSQIVPRLQTYLADRINRNQNNSSRLYDYDYYGSSGINMTTINQSTPLSFQPDVSLNTLMVYGSKADREAVGAMIVLLDDVELFPQPITKPYKIKVENTSTTRMAQQVLSAFSRKFQTTLMPGNLSPRITPNPATNSIEVYAPEALAKEIEEYVKEVDKEILEESVRKVRVIELKSMNSKVLASYLQNLRAQQSQPQFLTMPYIGGTAGPMTPMNPYMGFNPQMNAANRARFNAMQNRGGAAAPRAPGATGGRAAAL